METIRTSDYPKLALRTANLKGPTEDLLHGVLGLCSEFSELNDSEADYNEEIGDICWYINLTASALGSDFDQLDHTLFEPDMDSVVNIGSCAGHLADHLKRHIYYGAAIESNYVITQLSQIKAEVYQLCADQDLEIEDVLTANINKLAVRFPDKFSEEAALNRNLSKEKEALN